MNHLPFWGWSKLCSLSGLHFLSFWPKPSDGTQSRPICIGSNFLSFGLLGLHFLPFWPFGPSFPFILGFRPSFPYWPFGPSFFVFGPSFSFPLAFWAVTCFHCPFGLSFPTPPTDQSSNPWATKPAEKCMITAATSTELPSCSEASAVPSKKKARIFGGAPRHDHLDNHLASEHHNIWAWNLKQPSCNPPPGPL